MTRYTNTLQVASTVSALDWIPGQYHEAILNGVNAANLGPYLQRAIDRNVGKRLILPQGTYYADGITLRRGSVVIGENATIAARSHGSAYTDCLVKVPRDAERVRFEGVNFNAANYRRNLVYLEGTRFTEFERCGFESMQPGYAGIWGGSCLYLEVSRCNFAGNGTSVSLLQANYFNADDYYGSNEGHFLRCNFNARGGVEISGINRFERDRFELYVHGRAALYIGGVKYSNQTSELVTEVTNDGASYVDGCYFELLEPAGTAAYINRKVKGIHCGMRTVIRNTYINGPSLQWDPTVAGHTGGGSVAIHNPACVTGCVIKRWDSAFSGLNRQIHEDLTSKIIYSASSILDNEYQSVTSRWQENETTIAGNDLVLWAATGLTGYTGTANNAQLVEDGSNGVHGISRTFTVPATGPATYRVTMRIGDATVTNRPSIRLNVGGEYCHFSLSAGGAVGTASANAHGAVEQMMNGTTPYWVFTLHVTSVAAGTVSCGISLSTDGSTISYTGTNGLVGATVVQPLFIPYKGTVKQNPENWPNGNVGQATDANGAGPYYFADVHGHMFAGPMREYSRKMSGNAVLDLTYTGRFSMNQTLAASYKQVIHVAPGKKFRITFDYASTLNLVTLQHNATADTFAGYVVSNFQLKDGVDFAFPGGSWIDFEVDENNQAREIARGGLPAWSVQTNSTTPALLGTIAAKNSKTTIREVKVANSRESNGAHSYWKRTLIVSVASNGVITATEVADATSATNGALTFDTSTANQIKVMVASTGSEVLNWSGWQAGADRQLPG